jgi:S1-C subfamily serine protease
MLTGKRRATKATAGDTMSDARSGHESDWERAEQPQPAPPAAGGAGWPTAPVHYGHPGAEDRPGGWAGVPGAGRPPRRRGRQVAIITTAAVVSAAVGAGIVHLAWKPSPAASTSAPGRNASPTFPRGSAPPTFPGPGSAGSPPGNGFNPFQQPSGTPSEGSGGPTDVAAIAAKVAPALVDVNSAFGYQSASGAGTGIVLTSTGEVLTNNHVIDGATSTTVKDVGNGKTYSASVVGYDSTHDIAVLQLHGASGLRTAVLGDSATAKVAQPVVAVGNAGGTGGTPSSAGGSITALDQAITASDSLDGIIEQLSGLIEINADIQAGDSGGSLVNTAGQVIGIDTAASTGFSFTSSPSSGTQGFAIPIDQALSIAGQIEAGHGSADVHVGATAFLGVQVSSAGQGPGGFPGGGFPGGAPGGSGETGAVVSGVVNGTAAQQAGLTAGDVITSLAGQSVDSPSALSKILVVHHPGDTVQLEWTKYNGQAHTATIGLSTGPPA